MALNISVNREETKRYHFCNCVEELRYFCECGEVPHTPAWGWSQTDKSNTTAVSSNGQLVSFHNSFSHGTASVKGNVAFVNGYQYFWEMKIVRPVYGTSVMVGVGTENVNVSKYDHEFRHLLGEDAESWGLTYDGWLWHNGVTSRYHPKAGFQPGSIVGIHLDMWHGTLEFFLNRQSLGIAFRNLRNHTIYPMICSTAARSSVHLIYSSIQKYSLFHSALRKAVIKDVESVPFGLQKYLSDCWWNFPKSSIKESKSKVKIGLFPQRAIYVLLDSDDEEGDNDSETSKALTLRMKRVLENSASSSIDTPGESKPLTIRPKYKRTRH